MRIAVSSQNFRTITGHAGKSRRFIVYEVAADGAQEVERLDLPKKMSLHDYHEADHPLYQLKLDAILTGGAGAGFMQRMGRAGIQVIATSETEIETALAALVAQRPLPPAAPHDHEHEHDHDHDDDDDADPDTAADPRLAVAVGADHECCGGHEERSQEECDERHATPAEQGGCGCGHGRHQHGNGRHQH
ncbi:hypothetical protein HUU62_01390 [Rhodoferax sp. 4810]|uniref:Dinitrogenase iron-molybdenum cofactor biosynthesis domain-containing protein n=1 Tax=Thiospirillum jenense TaxID=1653858 RepID=A0A839HC62_9GAMM|nr:hypothetical protein [Rhodoferax jenense]MBB1125016.1 hypothetical protein [Thiospirillum jenense]